MGAAKVLQLLRAVLLGAAVVASAALGLVFPVPPPLLLAARRRLDRTELIRPAGGMTAMDSSEPVVLAELLDRRKTGVG
ncbi:MAG TPA: hypothetical protein VHJ78_05745 [Actinomycetota bacterium]|nr:hypothetical protein [Actinomycetota bacterium]